VSRSYDFINEALAARAKNDRLRSLVCIGKQQGAEVVVDGQKLINFCSNDYLGLSSHPKVVERAGRFVHLYGAGSTASRLISGNFDFHEQLETKLARAFNAEAVLLFNTGFQANMSVLGALADRHSLIIADRKCHNSLIQGALLSRAEFKRFDHNDYTHLEKQLQSALQEKYNRIWIVSETLFSMDGDRSKVDRLIQLAEEYNALLFLDDAHAIGVLGKDGLGLTLGHKGIDIRLGTFGKAFGSFGAFVACSKEVKEYLVNFCAGFIYTTAPPPAVAGAVDAALEIIPAMNKERNKLFDNIRWIKQELKRMGFSTGKSDSQIIPVVIGEETTAIRLSEWLATQGIWLSAVRPPTVPSHSSRLRLTLTVNHGKSHIQKLLNALQEWNQKQK